MFYRLLCPFDARRLDEAIPSKSVHLTVTSPPYYNPVGFVSFSTNETDKLVADLSRIQNRKEFFKELGKVWRKVYEVTVPGGYLVVNYADLAAAKEDIYGYYREICTVGDLVKSVEDTGFYLISQIIWEKFDQGAVINLAPYKTYRNLKVRDPSVFRNWEYVLVFKRYGKRERELDLTEREWKEWNCGIWRIYKKKGEELDWADVGLVEKGEEYGQGRLKFAPSFPVELPERCIKIWSSKGDVVLDPFLGTGTTMLAAKKLGRSCIGVEVHEAMKEVIKRKVEWGSPAYTLTGEKIEWIE